MNAVGWGLKSERIIQTSALLYMSTNSKFLRNRVIKLIGKVPTPEEPTQTRVTPKRKGGQAGKTKQCGRTGNKSGLFRDYTYIRLHSRSGRVSRHFSFPCFRDDRIYDFTFPPDKQMLYDNDEQSNQLQIQEDIQRGYKALQKELADCGSHCEDTIASSELS